MLERATLFHIYGKRKVVTAQTRSQLRVPGRSWLKTKGRHADHGVSVLLCFPTFLSATRLVRAVRSNETVAENYDSGNRYDHAGWLRRMTSIVTTPKRSQHAFFLRAVDIIRVTARGSFLPISALFLLLFFLVCCMPTLVQECKFVRRCASLFVRKKGAHALVGLCACSYFPTWRVRNIWQIPCSIERL